MRVLGVGLVGVGWVATQHLQAFAHNRHVKIVALCSRHERRARARLAAAGIDLSGVRFSTDYRDLLTATDIDIISIATPNHLHAAQAVAAARAGKHILLEKPTGLDWRELRQIRHAVAKARVRTIVSFELRYNPYLRFAHWLREQGWLGRVLFASVQYLARVTSWYSGWKWVRTVESGRSHLLAAGCHAVDALRWLTGLEVDHVSALQTRVTKGYEWPTSIIVNMAMAGGPERRQSPVLAQLVSSLEAACPYADVTFTDATTPTGAKAIRVTTEMPGSTDVAGHPFQAEIDELVNAVLEDRETDISVFDAERTMAVCLAADRSAALGGRPVRVVQR